MSIRHAAQLLELLRLRDAVSVDEARERWTAIASWDALHQVLESEGATLRLHRRLHDRGVKP